MQRVTVSLDEDVAAAFDALAQEQWTCNGFVPVT